MADSFLRFNSLLPCVLTPFVDLKTPGDPIVNHRGRNILHSTRLLGFLLFSLDLSIHSAISHNSPSTPFSIHFRPQPFRPVIVHSFARLRQVTKIPTCVNLRPELPIALTTVFFSNRITCTCSCGAADHSVSKRYSDGGYFLPLCLSVFAT